MAVECELTYGTLSTPCGVQAVGRCNRCNRAFCGSHQAVGGSTTYTNLCSEHIGAPITNAQFAGHRFPHEARQELRKNRVQKVTLNAVRTVCETRRFGKDRYIDEEFAFRGWIMGQLPWSFYPNTPRSDTTIKAAYLTALTAREELHVETRSGLVRVSRITGDEYEVVPYGQLQSGWAEKADQALENLLSTASRRKSPRTTGDT
jgi:hypothetical protein